MRGHTISYKNRESLPFDSPPKQCNLQHLAWNKQQTRWDLSKSIDREFWTLYILFIGAGGGGVFVKMGLISFVARNGLIENLLSD